MYWGAFIDHSAAAWKYSRFSSPLDWASLTPPPLQVKLVEALNISRARKSAQDLVIGADPTDTREQQEKPDVLRVKVCLEVGRGALGLSSTVGRCSDILAPLSLLICDRHRSRALQLLRELGDALAPFRGVLDILRSELALSIFSDYYVSTGGSETFEQVS